MRDRSQLLNHAPPNLAVPAARHPSPLQYLAWMGSSCAILAVLAITFTVCADPYRMFDSTLTPRLTAIKPRIYNQAALAKTYQLERVKPETLLLGNSRVEIGLDPESPEWPDGDRPVFNAAEAGRDLFTAWRMLQEAIAVHPPSTVILGLDILDFLDKPDSASSPLPPTGSDENRLLVDRNGNPNPTRATQIWRDRVATTLTIDALLDSIDTVFADDPATAVTMTPNGFNPLHDYLNFARRSGYHELFAQKNALYAAQYRRDPHLDFADPETSANFRYLKKIMDLASGHHMRLMLFIHPYHADYLEILHEDGLWPTFEAWKRALVKVIASSGARADAAISLTDFSAYDVFTTEPVPVAGDLRRTMRWYWEAGHYKSALGEVMLSNLLGKDSNFGRKLNDRTIDSVLADINVARERYLARQKSPELPGTPPPVVPLP